MEIHKVAEYWNRNPVHSVEFAAHGDLKSYLDQIDELRWSDNERWAREKFYELRGNSQSKLLDAGCGIGVLSRFFARKGFLVHSLDLTEKAVEITRQSFEIYGLKGEVMQGSVEDVPYPDNYFDFVVSNGVIHHTVGTRKAVEEFFRVLKPGGIASVCIYYKNMLLREPLWTLVKLALPILIRKKEGREKLLDAKTPADFVRAYDGNDTPIAKLYNRKQADNLFNIFETLEAEPHYFPARFLASIKVGGTLHKLLDKYCGVLIYYLLKKPLN